MYATRSPCACCLLVALTADGVLDAVWGDGGIRQVRWAEYDDLALAARRDGSLVVPAASLPAPAAATATACA